MKRWQGIAARRERSWDIRFCSGRSARQFQSSFFWRSGAITIGNRARASCENGETREGSPHAPQTRRRRIEEESPLLLCKDFIGTLCLTIRASPTSLDGVSFLEAERRILEMGLE
jgi:hypothetical protein